ncbi:hypothetical protein [Thalassotalea sp. Y01]|uniref:hypothetical protein n=1 Tax=Thalassotalea sp. Y01 TaxID=2729613 RepID=UPI00145D06EF|nr:hypothetical protein [Thalassotalea sp. Y01]NMP15455.1 hypothetical protein [Thalassotalea sp. Y01]
MRRLICLIVTLGMSAVSMATTITVVTKQQQPVSGIVVYLEPLTHQANIKEYLGEPVVISQKDKKFTPYLTVVAKGTPVIFANHDDITHHIYTVNETTRFDFKLKIQGQPKQISFDTSNEIAMGCNIHDWMAGHLFVVDTPYFAMTDASGRAQLNKLPSGDYQIGIYHPKMSTQDQRLRYPFSSDLTQFTIEITGDKPENDPQQHIDVFDFAEGYE